MEFTISADQVKQAAAEARKDIATCTSRRARIDVTGNGTYIVVRNGTDVLSTSDAAEAAAEFNGAEN